MTLLGGGAWAGRIFSGEWTPGSGGEYEAIEPATGAVVGSVGSATAADVRKAAEHAARAQRDRAARPSGERAAVLRRAGRLFEEHRNEIEAWLMRESGAIRAFAALQVDSGGVVLARIFEETGLPAGLLHVLPGGPVAGAAVVEDPLIPVIAFTGSTRAGRAIAAAVAPHLKRVRLELGGNSALIVLDDVPLSAPAFADEIFGPVAPVVTFRGLDDAVRLATSTPYGLSLGILTRDVMKALALAERVPSGLVHINDRTVDDEAVIPFGGAGTPATVPATAAPPPTSTRSRNSSGSRSGVTFPHTRSEESTPLEDFDDPEPDDLGAACRPPILAHRQQVSQRPVHALGRRD